MSKLIPLTQGQFAIVDDEDYDDLVKHNWNAAWASTNNSFYVVRQRRKIDPSGPDAVRMHRIIMNAPKGMVVDHINHDTLDNRKVNLRVCTTAQNSMNKVKSSNNTSGYKGVCWHKGEGKWNARIKIHRKLIHLGSFICKEEAARSYNKASEKYHGEFGYKNIIRSKK
jgi:hypothetical protein